MYKCQIKLQAIKILRYLIKQNYNIQYAFFFWLELNLADYLQNERSFSSCIQSASKLHNWQIILQDFIFADS